MNNKTKLLSKCISVIILITFAKILHLNNSCSENAVAKSAVVCEISTNRGLNNEIGNTNIETPVTGINLELSNVSNNEIIKSLSVKYNWTTDRVKFRDKPNFDSDVIDTLDKRTKVIVISEDGRWSKIKYDGKVGFVYSEYLTDKELFTSNKNRWGVELTDDEIDLLAKIVWTECRGEIQNGRYAVIEIILNRVVALQFPDTLYEVLSDEYAEDKYQFTSWKHRNEAKPTKETYADIYDVLNNRTNVLTKDYLYFSTSPRNYNAVIKIGNHYFCKES